MLKGNVKWALGFYSIKIFFLVLCIEIKLAALFNSRLELLRTQEVSTAELMEPHTHTMNETQRIP
jgi:hypothetical protein